MFIKTFLSVLLSFFFISFFSISYTQNYLDVSLKEIDNTGKIWDCPPPQVKSDIVINPNAGMSGDGRGWSCNLYLKSEASKVVGVKNIIYDLTWLVASNSTYAGSTYTFDDVEIWMYEYSGVQFPNTSRPAVDTWVSPATTPVGVTNLKKVLNGGRIKIQNQTYDCIGFPVAMLDSPYEYSGNNSLVIYVQKKTKQTTANPLGYISYRQNKVDNTIRVLANWEGDNTTPLPNTSKISGTSTLASFARVVFNRNYSGTSVKKFTCNNDDGDTIKACLSICSVSLNNPSFCEGENANLVATPKDYKNTVTPTYKWDILPSGVTDPGNVTSFNITKSGKYQVTMTATNLDGSACTASKFVDIVVKPKPDPAGTITGSSNVCSGTNNVSFSVPAINNADSYIWTYSGTGATITNNGKDITINFASNATSGKLTVKGKNTCGEGNSSQDFDITVTTKPIISDITKSICSGLKFDTIPVANATNTIPAGTKYTWTVVADPEITGASPETSAQTNISQTLSNSATTSKIATYTVTATSGTAPNQCPSTFKVTVTVKPKPATPTFSNVNQPTCNTSGTAEIINFEIAPATPATYVFNPSTGISNNGKNITAASGKYKFVVIKDGCASDSSALLTMNDVPDKPVLEGQSSVCMGSKITLKAWKNKTTIGTTKSTSAATTPWTKDDIADPKISIANFVDPNTTSIEISTIKSGSVKITYTDINACTAEQTITVNPLPVVPTLSHLNANPILFPLNKLDTVCKGNSVQFELSGKAGETVYFKGQLTPLSVIIDPSNKNLLSINQMLRDTTIILDSITNGKCSSTINKSLTIAVSDTAFSLNPNKTLSCSSSNGSIEVTASTKGRLFWANADLSVTGTQLITTAPFTYTIPNLKEGVYTVKYYNGGCDLTKTAKISDPDKPSVPNKITSSGATTFCDGEFINLTASTIPSGATVNWTKNGSAYGTGSSVKVTTSGTYAVSVTVNGCTSSENDTIVTVNPLPLAPTTITNADKNQQFCKSENADISKLKPTTGVVWFDVNGNKKNNLAELLTETSYYAAIQDANGCYTKSTDRIEVKVKIIENPLSPVVGGPTVFCKADNKSIADLLPKSSPNTKIYWFLESDLTTPIPYTPVTPLTTGQYVPKAYVDGCYSLNTTPITVTIEDPQAPTLPTSKLCENNTVPPRLYDFYPNDNQIFYYQTNTSLVALPNKNLVKGLNEKYYVRTVTNNGCISLPTEIDIDPNFSSGFSISSNPYDFTSTPLCEIDKPDFDLAEAKFNTLPSSNGTIFWYQGKNDVLENNLPKDSLINSGSYWIAVKGTDGCFSKKQEVKLKVDSGVKPTFKPIELCYTSSYKVADLDVANVSNPIGILTWYLAKDGTVSLDKIGPVTNDPNVQYWATYKKTNTECESNEKVKLDLTWIKFNQQLQLDETSQKFCKSKTNKVSDLNLSPNTSTNVAWFQTLTEATPIDPTTNLFEDKYYAGEFKMTTDNKYCVNSQRKVVDVSFYSSKMYPLVKESVCTKQNGSIEFLNPPAGYVFNWYETSNINVLDFTGTKYLKPLEKQSFKIVMEDAKGCKDEVTISMPLCSDAPIPQFLTPQSPGGNDKWVISFSAKYTKVQVRIFNRWGNEVYVSPIPYMDDWDGKRDNEYLPTGTYYYVIDKGNGDPIVTGFIELVK